MPKIKEKAATVEDAAQATLIAPAKLGRVARKETGRTEARVKAFLRKDPLLRD